MKKKLLIVLFTTSGTLGACNSLSQAALVYSSAVHVGVNVAAATPTNPGVELGIGYEQLDAAYVPVSVARVCPVESAASCNDATHPIRTISGLNNQDHSDQSNESDREAARTRLQEAAVAEADVEARLAQARSSRAIHQRELDQARTQAPAPTDTSENTEEAPATVTNQAAIDRLTGQIENDNSAIQNLEGELRTAIVRSTTAENHLAALIGANNQNHLDSKEDALSVYGSFNATATGTGGNPAAGANVGGGLNLGKVFSTGVASQNITQGIGASARANSLAQCLGEARLAVSIFPVAEQPAQLARLVNGCATAVTGR